MFSNCHHNSLFRAGSILGTINCSNCWGEEKKKGEQQLENKEVYGYLFYKW